MGLPRSLEPRGGALWFRTFAGPILMPMCRLRSAANIDFRALSLLGEGGARAKDDKSRESIWAKVCEFPCESQSIK